MQIIVLSFLLHPANWKKKKILAWYAEFLLEIDLKILLRKTGTRLNLKITLISLHIDPGFVKHCK